MGLLQVVTGRCHRITFVDLAGWDSHPRSADDQKRVRMTQLGHRWALVGGFLELGTERLVAVRIRGRRSFKGMAELTRARNRVISAVKNFCCDLLYYQMGYGLVQVLNASASSASSCQHYTPGITPRWLIMK